ncbi:MAG: DUF2207 domain-containing protein, partial [Sphingomicrobium sp.]
MRSAWSALPPLLLFLAATAAQADERILRFVSDVQIRKDSTLDVTETIAVRAEGGAIRHGIVREFPTRYRGPHGSKVRVGFTFEGATLDGMPVAASTETIANGVRIKVGDPDKLVDPGEHSYALHYRTTRQIGRFDGYDELYWNATGTGWAFPIDEAIARIRLPGPVSFGQRSLYTGAQGATAANAVVSDEKPGEIAFRTTVPLGAYEGLTVAAAFPKGAIDPPGGATRAGWLLADYGPPALGVLALLGLLGFYVLAWRRAGRNPRAGTVVPIFAPPDALSPAGMRFVVKMAADNRAFAAALIDMGVRGHVKIAEDDGGFFGGTSRTIERLAGGSPLPKDEQAALEALCEPGETIAMKQTNHEAFASAKSALSSALKEQYEGTLFKRNYGWAVAGALFFAAGLWTVAAAVAAATGSVPLWPVGVVLASLAAAAIAWLAFHDSAGGKCILVLVGFVALAVSFALGMPIIGAALDSGWLLPLLLPALAFPLVISGFWWMAAPTSAGRKVLDDIAGFKQYLSIAEGERLDRMTPPKDTPAIFEKYLPYAIALGVENHWAKRFASVLAAAADGANSQGRQGFAWYSGTGDPWSNPGQFVDHVGSSLASTISSASTAPGSSSGSG